MSKRNGIFLVVLLASVIVTIIIFVISAQKDVEQYNEMQQSIEHSEEQVEDYGNTLNELDQQNSSAYDALDEEL